MRILFYFFALYLLFTSLSPAQLNGIKTINPSGSGANNYTTFTEAISALNTAGTTTGVTFLIASGTYTEAAPLIIDIVANKPTALATVTFKPDADATVVLNVGGQTTGTRYAIRIGKASVTTDYIILDGSNSDGGTTRNWTIKATATTNGTEPIDIYGDYITIKNCIIDMYSGGYLISGYGISLRDAAPTSTNCTIRNNKITGSNTIAVGRGTAANLPGHLIKGNELHCKNNGIFSYCSSNIVIEDNTIIGDASTYYQGSVTGIYITTPAENTGEIIIKNNIIRDLANFAGTLSAVVVSGIFINGQGTYTIERNKIFNIYNSTTGSGSPSVYGINFSGAGSVTTVQLRNNSIYNLLNSDPDPLASSYTIGFKVSIAGSFNIYYNTIIINETTRDHLTCAINTFGGTVTDSINFRNNILINYNTSSTYKSYVIYKGAGSAAFTSNNNILYAPGAVNSYTGFSENVARLTLADWQSTGFDLQSKSKAVNFTADCHITGASLGDGDLIGIPIAGITTDIDGDLRSETMPYIGSDEGETPLPVELKSFSSSVIGTNVVLSWTTASEISNYGFEILKSENSNMANAKVIGFIPASGNSNSEKSYSFTDNEVSTIAYYQLKQIDNNGQFKLSGILKLNSNNMLNSFALSQNYPNPFNPSTKISYTLPYDCNVTLSVYSVIGELVSEIKNVQNAGSHEFNFNAAGLNSGVYLYKLSAVSLDGKSNFNQIRKMMFIK